MPTLSRKASPGCRTWRERNANFFLHFWRRSTSTGRISSRHRFAQTRNQSNSFPKKSDLHTPPLHGDLRATDKQSYRQTGRQLNARRTYRILRILSVIKLDLLPSHMGQYNLFHSGQHLSTRNSVVLPCATSDLMLTSPILKHIRYGSI